LGGVGLGDQRLRVAAEGFVVVGRDAIAGERARRASNAVTSGTQLDRDPVRWTDSGSRQDVDVSRRRHGSP
jgi:hypothetical protein